MNEPTCRAVVGGTQGDPGGTLSYCGQPESARIHSKQFVETVGHAFVGPTPDLEAARERVKHAVISSAFNEIDDSVSALELAVRADEAQKAEATLAHELELADRNLVAVANGAKTTRARAEAAEARLGRIMEAAREDGLLWVVDGVEVIAASADSARKRAALLDPDAPATPITVCGTCLTSEQAMCVTHSFVRIHGGGCSHDHTFVQWATLPDQDRSEP